MNWLQSVLIVLVVTADLTFITWVAERCPLLRLWVYVLIGAVLGIPTGVLISLLL